jgi:two-component system chemotaxis response regulator CheB
VKPARKGHDTFPVLALVASAGGLRPLSTVLGALPADLPAAIVVLQRLVPDRRSLLASILARRTRLAVKEAADGDRLHAGVAFVAPPGQHLFIDVQGTIRLSVSGRVHFVRPSADLLFESLAKYGGHRAVVVVLTGTGSDGAVGVNAIGQASGTVIAQDETTAEYFGMPAAAVDTGNVDLILPLPEIAPTQR